MAKYHVCYEDELLPDERMIVEIKGRSIGVFNVKGEYFAVRNRCPHKGAPLCLGLVKGLVVADQPYEFDIQREGEILRCPWHGWEFDIKTGGSVFNPHRIRVKRYDVTVEGQGQDGDDPDEEDPSIETFAVTVERQDAGDRASVYVHVT